MQSHGVQYWLISGFAKPNATVYNRRLGDELPIIPITETDDYYIILIHSLYSTESIKFTKIVVTASWGREYHLIESCILDCGIDVVVPRGKRFFVIISNDGEEGAVEIKQELRKSIWTRLLPLWFFIAVFLFSIALVLLISLFYAVLGWIMGDIEEVPRDEREEEREYSGWGIYRHEALPLYVGPSSPLEDGDVSIPEYEEDVEDGVDGPPSYKSADSVILERVEDGDSASSF
jgi:hypothetical protein